MTGNEVIGRCMAVNNNLRVMQYIIPLARTTHALRGGES
jgi:hypothetical protein